MKLLVEHSCLSCVHAFPVETGSLGGTYSMGLASKAYSFSYVTVVNHNLLLANQGKFHSRARDLIGEKSVVQDE